MRALMMGIGAEQADTAAPLLEQIKDLDLRLLAQAALARGSCRRWLPSYVSGWWSAAAGIRGRDGRLT